MSCSNHFGRWPTFPRKLESTLRRAITADRLVHASGAPATEQEVEMAVACWIEVVSAMLAYQPRTRLRADQCLQLSLFTNKAPTDMHCRGSEPKHGASAAGSACQEGGVAAPPQTVWTGSEGKDTDSLHAEGGHRSGARRFPRSGSSGSSKSTSPPATRSNGASRSPESQPRCSPHTPESMRNAAASRSSGVRKASMDWFSSFAKSRAATVDLARTSKEDARGRSFDAGDNTSVLRGLNEPARDTVAAV
eukprot:CAMPEP_0174934894 /NCGR_PEP_ID=MMETSP1355-20121228/51346_1 /TAXON_ID=464990 /ORGANISM="Hemiselmis tepida, Strain CCMP443" /LENGTH=248 /DNA_ID=CAMNT_0016181535 /DNA_START=48 /DNA_END=790 /DNA_ORIENTATION=-